MNSDYKEVFQQFYDEAIEYGMSEDEAGMWAEDRTSDYYADELDSYMNYAEDR